MLDFICSRFRTLAVLCIALALALGPGGGHRILIRGVLHWMGEPKVLDPPEDVAVLRDIEFSREGPLTLDLFTPQSRSAAPLPVVHCPHTAPTLHQTRMYQVYAGRLCSSSVAPGSQATSTKCS